VYDLREDLIARFVTEQHCPCYDMKRYECQGFASGTVSHDQVA
jgi:hypothetical protein